MSLGRVSTCRLVLLALAILSAPLLLAALQARAEVVTGDGVLINFQASILPRSLPRQRPAPVSLHVDGRVRSFRGEAPKGLDRVIVQVNRHAIFSTRGLASCNPGILQGTRTHKAIELCGDALIGTGYITSHIDYPEQAPFPTRGRVLVFNSTKSGHHALVVHVFGRRPAPISTVLGGYLYPEGSSSQGPFGPRLVVKMPKAPEGWGYVSGFGLTFHRRFEYRGKPRSLIRASCPAPQGVRVAPFRSARGTFELSDGQVLVRSLGGHCKVTR